jgi:hypothetical protein
MAALRMKQPTRGVIKVEGKDLENESMMSIVGPTSVKSIWYVRQLHCRNEIFLNCMIHQGNNTLDGDHVTEAHRMTHNSQENEAASSLDKVTRDSEEDELARSLADRLSGFRSRSLPDIHIEDLVFCEPSREDDTSIPPMLQNLAGTNTRYLKYRDWIVNQYLDTSSLECNRSEHCKLLKDQLLDELRIEWAKLDELKLRAWRRAPQNSPSAPPCSNPNPDVMDLDSTQVIDTCGCLWLIFK